MDIAQQLIHGKPGSRFRVTYFGGTCNLYTIYVYIYIFISLHVICLEVIINILYYIPSPFVLGDFRRRSQAFPSKGQTAFR